MNGRMVSNEFLLQILVDCLFELLSVLHCLFYPLPSFLLLGPILVVHPQFGKGTEVINGVVKACPLFSWIIFLGFGYLFLAFQVNCSQLCLLHFLLLLLLQLCFPLGLDVGLSFLLDELFNFDEFLLGSSQVMLRTLVGTLIRLVFILLLVFLDPLLDEFDLLLLLLEIGRVCSHLAAFKFAPAMIRLMVPLVSMPF
jgi:hypothetical protein